LFSLETKDTADDCKTTYTQCMKDGSWHSAYCNRSGLGQRWRSGEEIMRKSFLAVAFLALLASAWNANAAPLNIVALGASNTSGRGQGSHPGGVSRNQAYPAQLEAMLRAKGIDAHVRNAGIPGDTTGGMLQRMDSAVPNGTQIVILQTGGNDARKGVGGDTAANTAQITGKLQARGIKVILLDNLNAYAPSGTRDPDGEHYNAQGHAAIAAGLLPRVLAAAGR
jgi:acyl-CoA thioesterase-1